jgi:hypothetical protein
MRINPLQKMGIHIKKAAKAALEKLKRVCISLF